MRKELLTAAAVGLFALSFGAGATPCGTTDVTPNEGCEDGEGVNDFLEPTLAVNDQSIFGQTDWEWISKQNIGEEFEGDPSSGLEVTATGFSFSANLFALYEQIMAVIKVGGGQSEGGIGWSAYLLSDSSCVAGTCSYTFDGGMMQRGWSHVSLYGRGEPTDVPEPGTLALLGLGLAGLGFGARRKKA